MSAAGRPSGCGAPAAESGSAESEARIEEAASGEDLLNPEGSYTTKEDVALYLELYNSLPDGGFADTPVTVTTDGRKYEVPAGSIVRLTPGESISLPPFQYHAFWGEGSKVLVGEVSMVNDDNTDNYYHDPVGRFPKIEEDEAPLYLLCNEYPEAPECCGNGDGI